MQFSKKIFGDSDKKAYFCSNKSHHASQRCVPRWDFAFYMGIWTTTNNQLHHLYKSGSTFEQAIYLYLFDKELRQLIFKAIQDIEISLRTKMIQMFSIEHGAFWFMDSSLFKNEEFYQGCLDNIKKEVSRSNEDFIKEHSQKYTYPALPPVWKTLEVVSFGTLSKLFCLFKDNRLKSKWQESLDFFFNGLLQVKSPSSCTISYAPYYIWSKLLHLAWTWKVLCTNYLLNTPM